MALISILAAYEWGGLFGDKEPGLAKILLDMGVFEPHYFYLKDLRKRAEPSWLRVNFNFLGVKDNTTGYAEFYAQVSLERKYPEEYISRRGQVSSYRDELDKKSRTLPSGVVLPPPRKINK